MLDSHPSALANDRPSPHPPPPHLSTAPDGLAQRPLRIALTSYRSAPFVGGQGIYVSALSAALTRLGHAVTVISGPPYPELDPSVTLFKLPSLDLFTTDNALLAFRPRFAGNRADLCEWWLHNTGAFGELFAFDLRFMRWWAHNGRGFDVIHDNQTFSRGITRLATTGVPVVTTLHHPISEDIRLALAGEPSWLKRQCIRRWHSFTKTQARLGRQHRHILTVSEASKHMAVADFKFDPDAMTVSPNGVDHDVFFPDGQTQRDPKLIVTTASADTPLKGLPVLIKALHRVRQHRADTRLVVIGEMRDRGATAQALAQTGLMRDGVEFTGRIGRTALADLFRRAGVAVFPSRFEGFGLPAAEAMACGACVVTSDGGALPEVVGDAGVVTRVGDVAGLADALMDVLGDPARRLALGAKAAARARAVFCWEKHAQAALALYQKAGAYADNPG